jgi:hypothetical protein
LPPELRLPQEQWEMLYPALDRLEALERREAFRLVQRKQQRGA